MRNLLFLVQVVLIATLFGAMAAMAADTPPAQAQAQAQAQPSHNQAPLWREVRSGEAGFTTTQGVQTGVLIQSEGESWRRLRNGPISLYGGILLLVVAGAIGVFYRARGSLKLKEPPTGRMIERFNAVERWAHWSIAISFVILAVSGLILLFGKHVLLPLTGYELFSWVAVTCKNLHNFVGPLFLLSVLVTTALFVKDNIWQRGDALWIRKAGGLFTGEHVPSWRFNFGEKSWFWLGVVVLGLTMSVTGLIMDFPNFGQGRGVMQWANIIHGIGAIVFIALSLGHIYMGTIGVDGAYESMRYGYVDETWAKEHHELWYHAARKQQAAQPAKPAPEAGAAAPQA
jgi:formate dehydrogenase subunit gamma